MVSQENMAEADEESSPEERRAYMRLPLEERRKRLAEQADRMFAHYAQEPEQTERRAWQEGGIVEPRRGE